MIRRCLQVYVILVSYSAERPDGDDGNQTEEHSLLVEVLRHERSLLQSSAHGSLDFDDLEQRRLGSFVETRQSNRSTAGKAPGGGARCAGKTSTWQCKGEFKVKKFTHVARGQDRDDGDRCRVECADSRNWVVKDTRMAQNGVVCQDGKYDLEPQCIKKVQCPNGGGGWTCKGRPKGSRNPNDMLNLGQMCEAECLEPDFVPLGEGPGKCVDDGHGHGVYSPTIGCRALKRCPSEDRAQGWACQGRDARTDVPSGEECVVQCVADSQSAKQNGNQTKAADKGQESTPAPGAAQGGAPAAKEEKLMPFAPQVKCEDGKYSEPPGCGTGDEKKEMEEMIHKAAVSPKCSISSMVIFGTFYYFIELRLEYAAAGET